MTAPTEADKALKTALERLYKQSQLLRHGEEGWDYWYVTLAQELASQREAGRRERDGEWAKVLWPDQPKATTPDGAREWIAFVRNLSTELDRAEAECARLKQAIEAMMTAPPSLMSHAGRLVPINADGMREVVDECAKLRAERDELLEWKRGKKGIEEFYAEREAKHRALAELSKLREDRDRLAGLLKQAKLVAQDSIDRRMDEWPSAVPSLMGRLREIAKLGAK